ncbi:MAG: hypothetical protein U1E53_28355 [Dongiaceae bacterium]
MPELDPLAGEELIRISLEVGGAVEFHFEKMTASIACSFVLRSIGHHWTIIGDKSGDLSALWGLIGRKVRDVKWADSLKITFDDGSEIDIPSASGKYRGEFRGEFQGREVYEEF